MNNCLHTPSLYLPNSLFSSSYFLLYISLYPSLCIEAASFHDSKMMSRDRDREKDRDRDRERDREREETEDEEGKTTRYHSNRAAALLAKTKLRYHIVSRLYCTVLYCAVLYLAALYCTAL
jgi:hypothetical protein